MADTGYRRYSRGTQKDERLTHFRQLKGTKWGGGVIAGNEEEGGGSDLNLGC